MWRGEAGAKTEWSAATDAARAGALRHVPKRGWPRRVVLDGFSPPRIKIFMNAPRKAFPLTPGRVCLGLVVLLGVAAAILWRAQPGGVVPTPNISEIKAKAEQGDAQAQASLGDQYYYGQGLAKNQAEAVKWWLKAAEQGDPKSQFSLAFCYFQGLGVERDVAQALTIHFGGAHPA